jgi:hypothetical protein
MKYLFCRYDVRRLRYSGGRVCLICSRRPWCYNLSKAWLTSKKTAGQYCWSSCALFIISVRRWHCCIVECAFRKPNWCRGIHAWKCVSLYIILSRSFSKILDIIGKSLIGLYEVTSVEFFPGFGIKMIFACFRGTGQYCNLTIVLILKCFFCENIRRNRLFVDTTLWHKVEVWYNSLVMHESQFDELCDLRHTGASWVIYHHYHHHHYHLNSYEFNSRWDIQEFPLLLWTENSNIFNFFWRFVIPLCWLQNWRIKSCHHNCSKNSYYRNTVVYDLLFFWCVVDRAS